MENGNPLSMQARACLVLERRKPERLPFITRLETWYKSHQRNHSFPEAYRDLSLAELHSRLGIGQLKFMVPYALKLRGVEVSARLDGERTFGEFEPEIENFPGMWDVVATDRPGVTLTELSTPVGKLRLQHVLLPENVRSGTDPYLKEHLIKSEADYPAVEYILEHAEYVPRYDRLLTEQASLGENAWVVPLLHRIPFQQVLLEYLGETNLFYALYDAPAQVKRLLTVLDAQLVEVLHQLESFSAPYVEFPDNLHGLITNPKLFQAYCLPAYQKYTAILHKQGKWVGSHMDGDIRLLLRWIPETGLDVCESFSPAPLTPCTLEEALEAMPNGPVLWGAIPSPLLEESTSEADFRLRIHQILELAEKGRVILGITDLFMPHNSIERARYIAGLVNQGK